METWEGEQVDTTMVFVINYIIASSSKNYQLVTCYIVIITILPQAGGQQGWRALVHAKGEGGEDGQQVERLPLKMASPSHKVDRVPHILERIRSPSHVTTAWLQTAWSFRGFLVK